MPQPGLYTYVCLVFLIVDIHNGTFKGFLKNQRQGMVPMIVKLHSDPKPVILTHKTYISNITLGSYELLLFVRGHT